MSRSLGCLIGAELRQALPSKSFSSAVTVKSTLPCSSCQSKTFPFTVWLTMPLLTCSLMIVAKYSLMSSFSFLDTAIVHKARPTQFACNCMIHGKLTSYIPTGALAGPNGNTIYTCIYISCSQSLTHYNVGWAPSGSPN